MKKTLNVALLVEAETGDGRGILKGIAQYVALHGPWNFFRKPFYYHRLKEKQFIEQLKDWGPDGIILRELHYVESVADMKIPTVLCTTLAGAGRINAWPLITTNDAMIGKMAAEYLVERGFKNFAYCGFKNMVWSAARCQAFVDTVAIKGHKPFIYDPPAKQSGISEQIYLSKWLNSLPRPAAVFACNDERALEVIEACKAVDLHIPEQIAILGVSNDELLCTLSNPPLSSIARDIEKTGYEAAALLDKIMRGVKMERQKIILEPLYVVTRQSTNILATEDSDVAHAMQFIRNNANKVIQVRDVVSEVAISQRTLLKKFQTLVGHSINEEIIQSRIDHLSRILIETNLSISHIALRAGYSDINHISRYFKKIKGLTPTAYRKKYGKT